MGIDVIRRSCTRDDVVCLCLGEYPQNCELVCYRGKQAMSVWIDLGRDTCQISMPHEEKRTDVIQFETQMLACFADVCFLFLCLPFYLGVRLRVVGGVVLSEPCSLPCLDPDVVVCTAET